MNLGRNNRVPSPVYVNEILPEHLPDGLLSIVVFGPGKGEAILIRFPDQSIGVVDGCREPTRGDDDPLGRGDPVRELLNQINPPKLLFACLTHAHDDHFPGLGRLLEVYEKRTDHVWMVTDMGGPFMKAQLALYAGRRSRKGTLPDAMKRKGLERVIARFSDAHKLHGSRVNYLQAGLPLLDVKLGTERFTVKACGPGPGDLARLGESLVRSTANSLEKGEAVNGDFDLNVASGALLVQWEQAGVLLAGDLLCGDDDNSGWRRAYEHVHGPIQVVNVAHHASKEAHDNALWAKMSPDLAIVTPFKNGATYTQDRNGHQVPIKYPPRPEQIAALAKSSVVAITSPPSWDTESNSPKALRTLAPKATFHAKNSALPITPPESEMARRNAVAVSLDATGAIRRFVLAGRADVYVDPASP